MPLRRGSGRDFTGSVHSSQPLRPGPTESTTRELRRELFFPPQKGTRTDSFGVHPIGPRRTPWFGGMRVTPMTTGPSLHSEPGRVSHLNDRRLEHLGLHVRTSRTGASQLGQKARLGNSGSCWGHPARHIRPRSSSGLEQTTSEGNRDLFRCWDSDRIKSG